MRLNRLTAIAMTAGVLALASLACTPALFESSSGPVQPINSTPIAGQPQQPVGQVVPTVQPNVALPEGVSEESVQVAIYERVSPAVVNVSVAAEDQQGALSDFGSGSGFVVDPNGYIVTNSHVVLDADEVRVTFNDGRVFAAEVAGFDNYADIAVLKIDVPADYPLTVVELGDSSTLKVGQHVVVIGNPFGLTGSMSVGIVSAVGRSLSTLIETGERFSNPMIIQTDAAINPGNSGGPMLDMAGRVIGITEAIRTETGVSAGVGFAIPVNTVKIIVPQLIQSGKAEYPFLGVSAISQLSMFELAQEFDLPVDYGVLVQEVIPGQAADKAGLQGGDQEETLHGIPLLIGGDIIIAIDGVRINNYDEMVGYLVNNTTVGQTVTLTIIRDGKQMDVEVTLGARPSGSE